MSSAGQAWPIVPRSLSLSLSLFLRTARGERLPISCWRYILSNARYGTRAGEEEDRLSYTRSGTLRATLGAHVRRSIAHELEIYGTRARRCHGSSHGSGRSSRLRASLSLSVSLRLRNVSRARGEEEGERERGCTQMLHSICRHNTRFFFEDEEAFSIPSPPFSFSYRRAELLAGVGYIPGGMESCQEKKRS